MPRRQFLSILPPFVLLLLPCVLLWRVVLLGEAFVPADLLRDIAPWRSPSSSSLVPWNPLMWDGVAEFYPWRLFAAASLRRGELPLWNPHQFCGTPFVANSQSAVFYPPNLLFTLLPVPTAFGVSVLLHLALTGLLLYGFLRSPYMALGRAPAAVGAVVWQMSTWQASWLALPTFLCVSAWLPLALWLTARLVSRPTAARAAGLGACLGLMLLAGHLQIALYCLLLTLAYGLFQAVPTIREDRHRLWPLLFGSAFALLLMMGFAAPQLLPAIELSRLSHRAAGPPTWAGYEGYVRLALPAINLVTLFLPNFFGNPTQGSYWIASANGGPGAYMENACYVGVLGLLLGLVAVLQTWRGRADTRFFAIAALLALLLALGTPLNALLFFGIPGFSQSGSPGRILVLWTFCAAVLAALGTQALVIAPRPLRALAWVLGVLILLFVPALGVTIAWVRHTLPEGTLEANLGQGGDLWRLPIGVLFGAGALLVLGRRGTLSRSVLGAGLVGLAATDLLAANIGFNRSTRTENVYPVTPGIAYLQQHAGEGRVMPLNRRWSLYAPPPAVLPPNAATVYGLQDTQGYDSLLTGRYFAWAGALNGENRSPAPPENGNMVFTHNDMSPQAQDAAVRFVVSLGTLPSGNPRLTPVFTDGAMTIYENGAALPRARLTQGQGTASVEDVSPTWLRLHVSGLEGEAEMVVADQWYPGWRATVEGKESPIDAGPEVFRTVRLGPPGVNPGGTSTVDMRYLPASFQLGLYGLCLAIMSTIAVAVGGGLRGRLRRTGRGRG